MTEVEQLQRVLARLSERAVNTLKLPPLNVVLPNGRYLRGLKIREGLYLDRSRRFFGILESGVIEELTISQTLALASFVEIRTAIVQALEDRLESFAARTARLKELLTAVREVA